MPDRASNTKISRTIVGLLTRQRLEGGPNPYVRQADLAAAVNAELDLDKEIPQSRIEGCITLASLRRIDGYAIFWNPYQGYRQANEIEIEDLKVLRRRQRSMLTQEKRSIAMWGASSDPRSQRIAADKQRALDLVHIPALAEMDQLVEDIPTA